MAILSVTNSLPIEGDEIKNPEHGEYFEGDMQLSKGEIRALFSRTGLVDNTKRWPKVLTKTTVPYVISPLYIAADQLLIRQAMDQIQLNVTCIKFVPRTTQVDYIEIVKGTGCSSYLGRIGGKQTLTLLTSNGLAGSTCMIKGIIMHELNHALGFVHMQSAVDRDNFVTVNYANIQDAAVNNFAKYTTAQVNYFGSTFDINSVMMYSRKAFSKNGLDTIVTKLAADNDKIGQRNGMSPGDVLRLKNMYCV